MRDYSGLDRALNNLKGDLYKDSPQPIHMGIVKDVAKKLSKLDIVKPGIKVLDVGTGIGLGELELKERGCIVTAIDIKPLEPHVLEHDQSFLPYHWDGFYDLVWARHVLEHSVMPLYTLMEYRRVLKPGGHAYVEVPAPDTEAHHESNANHYSVLGVNAWGSLMIRLFAVLDSWEYRFHCPQDDGTEISDKYWGFLLQKEKPQ